MKTRVVWGLLVMSGVLFLSSCSKDSPKPDPVVGVWLRDYYSFSNAPSTFSRFNGFFLPNSSSTSGVFGEDSYTLTINNDKTYGITLAYPGPDSVDNGKWLKDTKTLTLTSNNTNVPANQFSLEQDVSATQLVIAQTFTFNLLPDAVADTITNAYATAHPTAYDQYYQNVDLKITFHFNKK